MTGVDEQQMSLAALKKNKTFSASMVLNWRDSASSPLGSWEFECVGYFSSFVQQIAAVQTLMLCL